MKSLSLLSFPMTDAGNAERLVALHGENLRRCAAWSRWLSWDGRRWALDDDAAFRLAKATARALHAEAMTIEDDDRRKAVATFALRSESRRGIEAMVALAAHEEDIAIAPDALDADPWALNVANGTVDLRTGEIRPHRRADLLTKLIPIERDTRATAPTWLAFLKRVLADNTKVIEFVWKSAGYSLTGDVREQTLFFLLGLGSNGKSTFLTLLRELLDGYARQAAPELLLAKNGESHPTDQADLFGCRLAICTEIEQGRAFAEVTVKQLTGGDRIKARRMRENFWEFAPTHKLWIAANHRPTIKGTDHAIWRRIRLVPFDVTIPASECDPLLPEKLRAELPGILNWAIEGCLAWQREGLGAPDEVKAATAEYREDQDILAAFLAECVELDADARESSSAIYASYTGWCAGNGEHPVRQRTFADRLRERGLKPSKGAKGIRQWVGLRLTGGGWRFVTGNPGSRPTSFSQGSNRETPPPSATPPPKGVTQ